ncbi:uncharacterized protein OCT59_013968 [Rhizophagus irregularis]|uniref:uncharacterized protein n=1 Tax=Rhizophagus irregularis TaxID=588596 RepID=UPI003327F8CC|nr:hypothetical protein OCT59_013968 [Rhizophagus irregularis]
MCLILNYSFNKTFLVSLLSRITATLWVSLDLFGHIGFHILIVSSSFSMQDFREFFCFLLILTRGFTTKSRQAQSRYDKIPRNVFLTETIY